MRHDNDDFMKKLAPRNVEELERIMEKYPIPPKEGKAMNDEKEMNIVDEPVEVIGKTPWYRSRILYTAASLVLTAGIGIGIAAGIRANAPADEIPDIEEAPTEYEEIENPEESPNEEDDLAIMESMYWDIDELPMLDADIAWEYEDVDRRFYFSGDVDNCLEYVVYRYYYDQITGDFDELMSMAGTNETFNIALENDRFAYENGTSVEMYYLYDVKTLSYSDTLKWGETQRREMLELIKRCDISKYAIVSADLDIMFNTAGGSQLDNGRYVRYYLLGCTEENSEPKLYEVYWGEYIDPYIEDQAEYRLEPVDDYFRDSVYFGSEFPRVLYADSSQCIFTEGSSGVFIYNFDLRDLCGSTDVRATLRKAREDGADIPDFYAPSLSACEKPDGSKCVVCFTIGDEMAVNGVYEVSFDRDSMIYLGTELPGDYKTIENSMNDLPANVHDDIFTNAFPVGDSGFVYLANNHSCDNVLPGEGSQLPDIDIVFYPDRESIPKRATPFGGKYDKKFAVTNSFGYDGIVLYIPEELEFRDSGGEHFVGLSETGEVVNFQFFIGREYAAESLTAEDAVRCLENSMIPFSDNMDKTYWKFTYDIAEDLKINGQPFTYRKGRMDDLHPESVTQGTIPIYFEAYYGVIHTDRDIPVKWIAYTEATGTVTQEYIHDIARFVAENVEIF